MVGVPGRSKGCHTCRKRSIRCDQQRPQCAQCIKSKRVCAGYQRERIFILNNGPPVEEENTTLRAQSNVSQSSSKLVWKSNPLSQLVANVRSRPQVSPPSAIPSPISGMPLQPAYRQQILHTFICSYIPTTRLGESQAKNWMMIIPTLPVIGKALESSILALSTARLGRMSGNDSLVHESLKLYTQGLWELQKALWNPRLMYQDDTLGACMALKMYEVLECPGGTTSAYLSHQTGCDRLIQLRGVQAHTSEFGRLLFSSFRYHGVLYALERHQPTYLSSPEWTTLPWSGVTKTPFDKLVDFLSIAPDIFRQVDELQNISPQSFLGELLPIIKRCWQLDADVEAFYRDLQESYVGPLYWPEFATQASHLDDSNTGKLFPIAFKFNDLTTANTLMLYWALSTMLWSGMYQLYALVESIMPAVQNAELETEAPLPTDDIVNSIILSIKKLPPLEHRADFIVVARNVCQSVEYCRQESLLGFGLLTVPALLSIVIETLKPYPQYQQEVLWGNDMMRKIRDGGLRILQTDKRL